MSHIIRTGANKVLIREGNQRVEIRTGGGGSGAIDNALETVRLVTQTQDNTVIYVDPAGDDANDGLTPGTAVQTLREASRRVPSRGEGLGTGPARIKLAVGTYRLPDVQGAQGQSEIFDSVRFHSVNDLMIDGTEIVDGTFTVLSTAGNVIRVTPDPGWTPGQWVGFLGNWDAFGSSFYQANGIIASGSDTLTIAVTETGVGGFISMPAPASSVRIEHLGSIIKPPVTNASFFTNSLFYAGNVTFQRLHFDGDGAGAECVIADKASKGRFWMSKFSNVPSRGIQAKGIVELFGVWFEGCAIAGIEADRTGQILVDGDCVFKNNSIGVSNRGGSVTFSGFQGHWHLANSVFLQVRLGSQVRDLTVRLWADGGGDFVRALEGASDYIKDANPLVTYAGHTAITRAFVALEGHSHFDLGDVANYVITPTTAFIDDNVAQLSRADFIAGTPPIGAPAGSISAPKAYVNLLTSKKFFEV